MSERKAQRRAQRGIGLPASAHHRRRCSVCCHPQREANEEAFLDWENVSSLTQEYRLPGRTAIYRHARALGLDARRKSNIRAVLDRIIERNSSAVPSSYAVLRAIEMYSRFSVTGRSNRPRAAENLIATLPDKIHRNPLKTNAARPR
jgi:hypothetical protein